MTRPRHESNWPAPDPVLGPALSRVQFEQRVGLGKNTASVLLKRTRDGAPIHVPFPEPRGTAVPERDTAPGRPRIYQRPQLWWWEADAITYGRAARLLDGLDRPKKKPTPEGDR
jgi:hypothetical protein